jgi:hypothetical protein
MIVSPGMEVVVMTTPLFVRTKMLEAGKETIKKKDPKMKKTKAKNTGTKNQSQRP